MNYKQIYAIEHANKQRILRSNPTVPDSSGIYILTREENGFKYAYIGQARHILSRLAQHLANYQHIDLSLKKRGLLGEKNGAWQIQFSCCNVEKLDEMEQYTIKSFADLGYQLYNHTTGSQGEGKQALGESKSPKGYREGLAQGYKNAQRDVKKLFDKYLYYGISGAATKPKIKAMERFKKFMGVGNDNSEQAKSE